MGLATGTTFNALAPTGPGRNPDFFGERFAKPESGDMIGYSIKNAMPTALLGVTGIDLIPSGE